MGVATQSLVRGSKERPRLDVYSYDAPKPGLDEDTAWIDTMAGDIYRYMNFDQIPEYREVADKVIATVAA